MQPPVMFYFIMEFKAECMMLPIFSTLPDKELAIFLQQQVGILIGKITMIFLIQILRPFLDNI